MQIFEYGKKEKEYLSKKDSQMKKLIKTHGHIEAAMNLDPFSALVSSIIGQQISTKAAVTVKERLMDITGKLTPENIYEYSVEEIQKSGLTFKKAEYIRDIAEIAIEGIIDFNGLSEMDNAQMIKTLTSLRGVGKWTVEMLLIFTFGRKDVLSLDDLAIQRGLMHVYGIEKLTKDHRNHFKELFSPYGSVAGLYIWQESATLK